MNAIVVGAGPAGVATAYLFARNGIDVTLIEREADFDRVFRGEGLMPSGVDALIQMGMQDLMESLPLRKLESWDMYIDRRETFSVPEPMEELGDRAVRIIPQAQFLQGVIKKCRDFQNFKFLPSATVRELIKENDRIAGVELEGENIPQSLSADMVIGCDGRGSLVRTRAGLNLDLSPNSFNVQWFKMPAPESLRERCTMFLMMTNDAMGACYTSWDGRLQYARALVKTSADDIPQDVDDWGEELAKPAPEWLGDHIKEVASEMEGPIKLNVIVGRCPAWTSPGLLLIGDAAHPMSPVRAQGINLALRDAIVTANRLVPLLKAGASAERLDAAARAVQTEREPEIKRSQHLQLQDTRWLGTPLGNFLTRVAGSVGPVMGKFQWAKSAWLNQQRDLRFGSTDVKLEV